MVVVSLDKFSSNNPPSVCRVQTINAENLGGKFFLEPGTIISGSVVQVHESRRGKRDSYLEIIPTAVTYKSKTINISNSKFCATIAAYKPSSKTALAGNVAIKAANFVVLGASQGISFTLGAAQSENGIRMKSGLKRMYNDSFVSYIEPGKELNVNVGDALILNLKNSK